MEERKVVYDDEIDLYELFVKLWKHKIFILMFTLLCTVASIVAVNIMPPKYKVTAQVVPNNIEFIKIFYKDLGSYGNIDMVLTNIYIGVYTEIIFPLFKSRDLAIKAVGQALGGNSDPEYCASIIDEEELSIDVKKNREIASVIEIEVVHRDSALAYNFANNLLFQVDNELKRIYNIKDSKTRLLNVTESPVMPKKPYSPKKSLVVAVAFVSSLFLALFLVLIIDWIGAVRKQYSPDRM
ncbi:MAG TPA: Wzz/FepE/Etk N-terminal domain-containing protein [Spirochaetota bacterium]|nr:Wzz/FepE/Etk N-terminal domain-containing protein [Spirochaetota bacterium]